MPSNVACGLKPIFSCSFVGKIQSTRKPGVPVSDFFVNVQTAHLPIWVAIMTTPSSGMYCIIFNLSISIKRLLSMTRGSVCFNADAQKKCGVLALGTFKRRMWEAEHWMTGNGEIVWTPRDARTALAAM